MTTMRVQTLKACRRVRHAVGSDCIGVARAAPLQARPDTIVRPYDLPCACDVDFESTPRVAGHSADSR
jgi:hypothetical protein